MPETDDEPRNAELIAYLDGELDEGEARRVEEILQADNALRHEAEVLKRTWELLDYLPQSEPSATFTSKTLDKLSVLRPAAPRATPGLSATLIPGAEAAQPAGMPSERRSRRSLLVIAAAAVVLFLAGYLAPGPFLRKGPRSLNPHEAEEQMARDLRVLDNIAVYQYADDLVFLRALDHPDLFGEDASGH